MSPLIQSHPNDGIYIYISYRCIFLTTEKRYTSGNKCISSKGVGNYICGNAAVKINLLINHVNMFYEKRNVNNIINSIAHISKDDVKCPSVKLK